MMLARAGDKFFADFATLREALNVSVAVRAEADRDRHDLSIRLAVHDYFLERQLRAQFSGERSIDVL